MRQILDIRYGSKTQWDVLSNLAPKPFVFRNARVGSLEAVLQAIKTPNGSIQDSILPLSGALAKRSGKSLDWRSTRYLFWDGEMMHRDEVEYQDFLDDLYSACWAQSPEFRKVLWQSKPYRLTHSIGYTDKERTILTVREFLDRLEGLRAIKNPA